MTTSTYVVLRLSDHAAFVSPRSLVSGGLSWSKDRHDGWVFHGPEAAERVADGIRAEGTPCRVFEINASGNLVVSD